MMRNILCLFLLNVCIGLSAQKSDAIIGDWVFHEVGSKADLSLEEITMLTEFFKKTAFNFSADGSCTVEMMGMKDVGTYSLKDEGTLIEMVGKAGKTEQFKIQDLSTDKLTLEMGGDNGSMVLKRKGSGSNSAASFPLKEATIELLAKKWWMQEMTTPLNGKVRRTMPVEEMTAAQKGSCNVSRKF